MPKPKRVLGMSPEAAYVLEKPHLQPLPAAAATGLRGVRAGGRPATASSASTPTATQRARAPGGPDGDRLQVSRSEIHIHHRGSPGGHPLRLDRPARCQKHRARTPSPSRSASPAAPALEAAVAAGRCIALLHRLCARPQAARPRPRCTRLAPAAGDQTHLPARALPRRGRSRPLHFGLFDLRRLERLILQAGRR